MNKPQKTKTIYFCVDLLEEASSTNNLSLNWESLEAANVLVEKRIEKYKEEGYEISKEDVTIRVNQFNDLLLEHDKKVKNLNYKTQLAEYEKYAKEEDQKLIDKLIAKGYTVTKQTIL